jgi:hypothetical protein
MVPPQFARSTQSGFFREQFESLEGVIPKSRAFSAQGSRQLSDCPEAIHDSFYLTADGWLMLVMMTQPYPHLSDRKRPLRRRNNTACCPARAILRDLLGGTSRYS